MRTEMQTEMTSLLNDLANAPAMVGKLKKRRILVEMLRRYSAKGVITIEKLSGPQYFNRKPATLKRYCRENDICFPDYVPMHLREGKVQ